MCSVAIANRFLFSPIICLCSVVGMGGSARSMIATPSKSAGRMCIGRMGATIIKQVLKSRGHYQSKC